VSIAGYLLGNIIPDVDKYLLPIIILIIVVSLLPSVIHVMRDEEMRTSLMNMPRSILSRRAAPVEADKSENLNNEGAISELDPLVRVGALTG
jgi:hypothetical protein